MMQMRTKGNDPAVSIRLNKEEWNDHVKKGNKFFKDRNVGYIQAAGKLSFSIKSPYYKEKEVIDLANKERSDEDQKKHDDVLDEIAKKNKEV